MSAINSALLWCWCLTPSISIKALWKKLRAAP